jgi:preprotein translocase subunit YajC
MNKKYSGLILVLLLMVLAIGGYFQFNKPARNLTKEKADLSIQAPDLFKQFSENETAANQKYLDKVVQVKGILKNVSRAQDGTLNLTLDAGSEMGGITCEVPATNVPKGANLQTGSSITIKGQCTGFLMDVVLVKCVIVN